MAGIRIEGNASGNVGEVDVNHNVFVNPPLVPTQSGFVALTSEVDPGVVTGSRLMRNLEATAEQRLRIAMDTPVFGVQFPGAAIDTSIWFQSATTQTIVQGSNYLTLNNSAINTINTYCLVKSYRAFPIYANSTTYFDCALQFNQGPVTNNTTEWGFGLVSTNASPTDGVFFRMNSVAEFRAVVSTAGVETTVLMANNLLTNGQVTRFMIAITDLGAEFYINNNLVASIPITTTNADGVIVATPEQPIFFRVINVGVAPPTPTQMKISYVGVVLQEFQTAKPWSNIMAGMGGMGPQGQTGGTMGSTALFTNNLAAGAGAAATNTTAALGSGLGGQFSLQPILAVPTDGIISSYQVPAGTNALEGKTLYITGVHITGVVSTVLVGGAVFGLWSLAFGHTAVALNTGEAAGTKAPRRLPLGIQTWAAAAAVGVQADRDIHIQFNSPIVVQPGEFVQTVMKNVGVVTTSGVITFLISFDSYWE
jgi:hypothetical protein